MRIPFPIRIPIFKAFVFASLLALVQLLEHTDPRYCALIFAFVMVSVFAFNTAGGFSRPSGGYIFFYATLAVIVGTVYKAFLGQPADSSLQEPLLLMSTHLAMIAVMLLAAYLTRLLVTTRDGMAGLLNVRSINFGESSIGCLALYICMQTGEQILPGPGGKILHSLNLINPFLTLSVILGTVAAVRSSGGRRSLTPITFATLVYMQVQGIFSFSKQGMFTPIVCWIIGMTWARFRLRPIHIIVLLAFAICAQKVFVPLSNLRDEEHNPEQARTVAEHYITHYSDLQKRSREWVPPSDLDWRMFYYGQPQGIWDRLSMLPNDSVLISFTDQGHYFGYKAIRYYFENWIPHIIDPHKLEGVAVGGNAYSHEMGGLAEGDTTTGISFSPAAEAYHIGGWVCLLLICPAIYLMTFMSVDASCGDIRRQPWGLFIVLLFAHLAPEGGIGSAIGIVWLGNVGVFLAVFCCGYITPVLGMLLTGNKRVTDTPARLVRPATLRGPALQAP